MLNRLARVEAILDNLSRTLDEVRAEVAAIRAEGGAK